MKKILNTFTLLFTLLLTSCSTTPGALNQRAYVGLGITYSEPTAQYAFRVNMDSTETESAKYFFEFTIKNEEREACIEATEKVLSNQATGFVIPEIYVFSQGTYTHKYVCDHKLYCSPQDWNSIEYISDVLLTYYGETAHYGTIFGYAYYLYENDTQKSTDNKFSAPSVTDVLDLNYLCFDEDFASYNDITIAKGLSCNFVDSYINNHGEKEFQQLLSSSSKALTALSLYYESKGLSYTPSKIQYGHGGKSYDYTVYTEYGTFFITKDWIDIHAGLNPLIDNGFLHSNYADTKAFFETNLKQFKQYQNLFKLDDYNNDLDIVFSNPISASKYSFYQSINHRIYIYNVDSLMHEYIHSLTITPTNSMANWQTEGLARYFSYYYDHYGMPLLNQDYNNSPNTPELKYIHEYLTTIKRPIDMEKDYCELENVAVYYYGFTDPNANYLAGSSFVQYLVKQYGEETVINSIYGNGNPLPKTYNELVKEWNIYIETNYKGYSKYK